MNDLSHPIKSSGLYDPEKYHDNCGVGFITRKDGSQAHEVLLKGHEALCVIPHRGGMSSEGVGDGAGINIDISLKFFQKVLGDDTLKLGEFGVANFFFPMSGDYDAEAKAIVEEKLAANNLPVLKWRQVPVNTSALKKPNGEINEASVKAQQTINQLVFARPAGVTDQTEFEHIINDALIAIEAEAYSKKEYFGFYPCSMSSRTQVYKGRLNSNEVVPYFQDLTDEDHEIRIFLFHTRFSTNTEPATFMAQPFRRMAHNGELNTDKKNRLSEDAIAKQNNKKVIFPKGQSDSARLDQTLARRIIEDELDIVTAVLAMMPPAWENDPKLSDDVRAMYEYFSLYEEKNDGPAALIFSDGVKVGARLDRLGLRPLRSIETTEYVAVMSEAGQISFPPEQVLKRGRIEAGGMLVFDHETASTYTSGQVEEMLAAKDDYTDLVEKRSIHINALDTVCVSEVSNDHELSNVHRHVAYSLNQESFRFLLDPMIENALEKVTAMGYGASLNVLNGEEGGMSRYFSQRFAQVTNPPLDSIREVDGMTLRVALGAKPNFSDDDSKQIVIDSPVIKRTQLEQIRRQTEVSTVTFDMLYTPSLDKDENEANLEKALYAVLDQVEEAATASKEIIILSDENISKDKAALPALLVVAAANQRLVNKGIRFNSSLIAETGQSTSSHDVATILGFGASAICPLTVHTRALELGGDVQKSLDKYSKAIGKSLMKIMGKFGLCTAESYIGGEFFEANYINTDCPRIKPHFPNITSPVGGAAFDAIAASAAEWHFKSFGIETEGDIPHLGLFKERNDGAGHSYGLVAVREYINMTNEDFLYSADEEIEDILEKFDLEENHKGIGAKLHFLRRQLGKTITKESQLNEALVQTFENTDITLEHAAMRKIHFVFSRNVERDVDYLNSEELQSDIDEVLEDVDANSADPLGDMAYKYYGFRKRTTQEIDTHRVTQAYREFAANIYGERKSRPAALRDIMYFPADINKAETVEKFKLILNKQDVIGNPHNKIKGLVVEEIADATFKFTIVREGAERYTWLKEYLEERFAGQFTSLETTDSQVLITATGEKLINYLRKIKTAHESIDKAQVQPAHQITATFSSAAMSHGALKREAHEAVSQGANIAGCLSNSGEGGEKMNRFDTIKGSSIKQVASGRFGVWAGYFADPCVQQVEIKIAQGAKPGEGGQLPSKKVTVEIASNRGGTPKIELVSPPPHHDTYSIEDLAQLIHDCKASRAKVIVKLVSSEGIGTIAVGVAKAGADVINVAGGTGGTGAANVTSVKNTGRSAELGIAEVHQALAVNGLRDKVILRASNAHQTGMDVIKSAVLGADSFEFGTTALMMLKCVMAKNCNIKCPAGLTTNPELFQGDARALAQYFLNVAHETREMLAYLGYTTLEEVRGKAELLHLVNHPNLIGQLDFSKLLWEAPVKKIENPIYLEADFTPDDFIYEKFETALVQAGQNSVTVEGPELHLHNRNKTVGGQLSVDIERTLNYSLNEEDLVAAHSVCVTDQGRKFLAPQSLNVKTTGSAGQSYGALLNNGITLEHIGTCNDGVGKAMSGGLIIVKSPGGGSTAAGENVLIGNFGLFGATGGQLYVNGEAGDRFGVRNSGTVAVIEGAGDFCCEYMTSGVVANLGSFGKGFGNGMSGGCAFQYDAENILKESYSEESVTIKRFNDSRESQAQEEMLIHLLEEQIKYTGSETASAILANWETEKAKFWYAIPSAMYQTQTAAGIAKVTTRKQMIEELTADLVAQEFEDIREAYENDEALHKGAVPEYGDMDTSLIFKLTISAAVFAKAAEMASERAKRANLAETDETLSRFVKNIIVTEEKQLLEHFLKAARDVYTQFEDGELASLMASKRVNDYKTALKNRDIIENNSRGAMAWIIEQDQANEAAAEQQERVYELFAAHVADSAVSSMVTL